MSVLVKKEGDTSDVECQLIDFTQSAVPQKLKGALADALTEAAFSTDGKLLVHTTPVDEIGSEVCVWDTATRDLVHRLKFPKTQFDDESA